MSDSSELPCPWSAYLVECGDGSLYCGVAIDVERRMRDHATPRGARYVRGHGGVKRLLWSRPFASRGAALRAELRIKALPRRAKLDLAATGAMPGGWPE